METQITLEREWDEVLTDLLITALYDSEDWIEDAGDEE